MKILLVDDNQFNLAIEKEYLEELPGVSTILICKDPTKVKNIIDENDIDILILDIIMPVISGLDLLKSLREDKNYDDIPIIMLTSLDDTDSYKKCFELGAFDYINKPINAIEFNSRLKVAIEAKNSSNYLKSLVAVTGEQNRELKRMNAELTDARFQLFQSEKMAAIGQLSAGIAHEINNPLGFVNSNYEILHQYYKQISDFLLFLYEHMKGEKLAENIEILQFITEIQEKFDYYKIDIISRDLEDLLADSECGIKRVTEIVQSLRIFTRTVRDDEKSYNALVDLINQAVLISKNEFKYVTLIDINVPEDIILYCNRVQIGQVIVNIFMNAAQAIKSDERDKLGLIKISASQTTQDIMIQITNDGPTIPEENLSKIFDPFFTTKEIGLGTGLGLSISYDIIVNKHNGTIEAKNEPGSGVTFTILLPMHS